MKAIITGIVTAFRYVDLKGSGKVGQVDLVQSGDQKYSTKVVSIYVPNGAYCRLILEQLEAKKEALAAWLVWITVNREMEIEVIELLSIAEG